MNTTIFISILSYVFIPKIYKIMGIGMIKNRPICGNKLYNRNYNKYIYSGKYRIGRE